MLRDLFGGGTVSRLDWLILVAFCLSLAGGMYLAAGGWIL
jgi:hypothetical protein